MREPGGTLVPLTTEYDRVGSPLTSGVLALDQWTSRALSRRWSTTNSCATARSFWPRVERQKSKELFALGTVPLAAIVGVLTGHCSFMRYVDLAEMDISRLNKLVMGSKRFVDM